GVELRVPQLRHSRSFPRQWAASSPPVHGKGTPCHERAAFRRLEAARQRRVKSTAISAGGREVRHDSTSVTASAMPWPRAKTTPCCSPATTSATPTYARRSEHSSSRLRHVGITHVPSRHSCADSSLLCRFVTSRRRDISAHTVDEWALR